MTDIKKRTCIKCKSEVYLTIDNLCYDCFFEEQRKDRERRKKRKEELERKYGKKNESNISN